MLRFSTASLTHQHVVSVHDQGNDGSVNAIYLVMELVPGHTVRELLQERGPLSAIQALAVMDPLLQALTAAHEAGFVHRDIKPENIIIALLAAASAAVIGVCWVFTLKRYSRP